MVTLLGHTVLTPALYWKIDPLVYAKSSDWLFEEFLKEKG